jgi:undecaprenyl diphosphate synthase
MLRIFLELKFFFKNILLILDFIKYKNKYNIQYDMAGLLDIKKIITQRTTDQKDVPKHVIVNLYPCEEFKKVISLADDLMQLQINKNIPILTLSLGNEENIDQKILFNYIEKLSNWINEKKIKFTVIGKWYELEGRLVEELKKLNTQSSEFDHFFLNLCINYNPKQEIADACRVIIRKIIQDKSDIDSISPELIKENIYSSFLIPPEIVIEPSLEFSGTFLWDSKGSKITNLNKPLSDISIQDIEKKL